MSKEKQWLGYDGYMADIKAEKGEVIMHASQLVASPVSLPLTSLVMVVHKQLRGLYFITIPFRPHFISP